MASKLVTSRAGPARKRARPRARTWTKPSRAGDRVAAIERVVAALAHDIRTPLTGILALAELLAASDLGERERRWVATLKNNAEHLDALTTLFVDGARTRASKSTLCREPFDPRALAAAAAASLAARADAADLACVTAIAPDMPDRVVGDAVRLRAALENLIDNAVKFTERGEVSLKVSSARRARALRLIFAVSDSGIGLTALEIKRLFRPFTQAHSGIAERYGGAGLGLSLVKRLARAMGGDLDVTSTPGRGSTFRLTVEVGAAPAPDGKRGLRTNARGVRPLHVLHVEDNPYGRVVMNTILTGLGHRADFVASADAAVAAVAKTHYDLVLMDVAAGAIDGLEATRRIRALAGGRGQLPIVGISGQQSAVLIAAAGAAGMNDYLVKPVSPRALAEKIAAVTGA